ncbi:MAG TPA: GNAT family N-acetyltransferase [Roseiflexaceae bacterium]|nr:GNAT family N-acetyltransferase [Roseiflexaceae bacterium]
MHIRNARPTDRAAAFEMVKTIWDGNDYIPDVWDEWQADPRGPLLVGELDGHMVALAKLSAIGPGEDWFHGLRVDPLRRGKGFARQMLGRCIELSRGRGARTLRYLTDEDNPTMHRLADDLGLRLAYAPRWYHAPMVPGAPCVIVLPPERLDSLLADLARSDLLSRCAGMYFLNWRNLDLTAARLREHLERGEVLALPNEDAWAIVARRDEGGLQIAHIEGRPPAIKNLSTALRMSETTDEQPLQALVPPNAASLPALLAAGFTPTPYLMRVYELRLSDVERPATNDQPEIDHGSNVGEN